MILLRSRVKWAPSVASKPRRARAIHAEQPGGALLESPRYLTGILLMVNSVDAPGVGNIWGSTKTGEGRTIRSSESVAEGLERLATRDWEGHGLMFPHRFGEPEDTARQAPRSGGLVPHSLPRLETHCGNAHAGYRRASAHSLTDPGPQEPDPNPQHLRARPPRPPAARRVDAGLPFQAATMTFHAGGKSMLRVHNSRDM